MKPTTFRAILYSIPLFTAPFTEQVVNVMRDGRWPTPQSIVACTIVGIGAVAVGLRAYYDGSAERARVNEIETKIGS